MYELNPSDSFYPIPKGMEQLGAACDRWFRAREARDGTKRYIFGRMGIELIRKPQPEPEPKPVKVANVKTPRIRTKQTRVKWRDMTEAQKAAHYEQKKRWKAKNADRLREKARLAMAAKRASMTPEELRALYDRQSECRRKRKEIANGR